MTPHLLSLCCLWPKFVSGAFSVDLKLSVNKLNKSLAQHKSAENIKRQKEDVKKEFKAMKGWTNLIMVLGKLKQVPAAHMKYRIGPDIADTDRSEAGPSVGGARKKVRMTGGHYCCVVGCHNNLYADGPRGIKFYRFPKIEKQPDRHEKWILKVNRLNPYGSQWCPVPGMLLMIENVASKI